MEIFEDVVIPRNMGRAFVVKKGQRMRVMAQSTVDFVAFNLHNLKERFNQARTKVNQAKIFISAGDKLYSKFNNVMFTILEDTYKEGTHDLQKGMCSRSSYRLQSKGRVYGDYLADVREDELPDHGCWENLTEALKPWNIPPEDIPSPFNIFQTMIIDGKTGRMEFSHIAPKPGDYIDLGAEMDCLVGISACPDLFRGGKVPTRVQIFK